MDERELTPPSPTIPALNFRITAALRFGQGGETEKFNDNLTGAIPITYQNRAQLTATFGQASGTGPLFSRSAMKDSDANIRRGQAALQQALLSQTTVHRAMFRNGLGWVDFVWGDAGTVKTSGNVVGGMGLAHILEARQRKDGMSAQQAIAILDNMVEVIARGGEFHRKSVGASERVGLATNSNIVWMIRAPGSNAWVVTAYEKNPDGALAGRATDAPTHATASLTRSGEGAGSDSSINQSDSEQWPSGEQGGVLDPVLPTQAVSTVTRHGMGADDNTSIGKSGKDAGPLFSRSPQNGDVNGQNGGAVFSRDERTDTSAFKNWFGDWQ
jgi:hypothetical protein